MVHEWRNVHEEMVVSILVAGTAICVPAFLPGQQAAPAKAVTTDLSDQVRLPGVGVLAAARSHPSR